MRSAGPTLMLTLLAGCTDLGPIPIGACGNSIVEENEDCDTFDQDGTCRPPGAAGQCRFDCSEHPDGTRNTCPAGFGCGSDGICRQASGDFEPMPGPPAVGRTIRLSSGDFNGDGAADLMTVGEGSLGVHQFDSGGAAVRSLSLGFPPTVPAIGRLTPDAIDDFVLLRDGINVFRGRSDGTVLPTTYSPFEIPGLDEAGSILILDAMPLTPGALGQPFAGEEMLFLAENHAYSATAIGLEDIVDLPIDIGGIAGKIPTGNLVEDPTTSPCEELVIAPRGQSWVWVFSPCVCVAGGCGHGRSATGGRRSPHGRAGRPQPHGR